MRLYLLFLSNMGFLSPLLMNGNDLGFMQQHHWVQKYLIHASPVHLLPNWDHNIQKDHKLRNLHASKNLPNSLLTLVASLSLFQNSRKKKRVEDFGY